MEKAKEKIIEQAFVQADNIDDVDRNVLVEVKPVEETSKKKKEK